MASLYEDSPTKIAARGALRALNAVAALGGLILSTIILAIERATDGHGHAITDLTSAAYVPLILSIALDYLDGCSLRSLAKAPKWLIMIVEVGISLGFLALMIACCFVISDLEIVEPWKIMLLTCNAMPWIICHLMHLFFTFNRLKDIIGFDAGWNSRSTCYNCHRRIQSASDVSGDSAKYSLLDGQIGDDGLEDRIGDASCQGQGSIRLTDDA